MRSTVIALAVTLFVPGLAAAQQKAPAPAKFRPYVINLVNAGGNFESSGAGQRPGWRTVGFWSYRTPNVGDIIVKRGTGARQNLTVWELESVRKDFTGSNGDMFWKGLMRDLVFTNTLTQDHIDAIYEAGRTQPELLPK